MLWLAMLAGGSVPQAVRAEPVEARSSARAEGRPSTSLGRTGKGLARPHAKSVIAAERAFAADAERLGQWAAFRKWAAADATMFVPQPVKAQDWLKDRAEPAKAIQWWPRAAWVSCDGTLAVDTGGWQRPDGSVGYFSTVWRRQSADSWRWEVDHGDALEHARRQTAAPPVTVAACGSRPPPPPEIAFRCAPQASGRGGSDDGTLAYRWDVVCGGGSRELILWLWNGVDWKVALEDNVLLKPRP